MTGLRKRPSDPLNDKKLDSRQTTRRHASSVRPMVDNHHRVINYLRLSVTDRCNLRRFIAADDMLERIYSMGNILPLESSPLDGPAHRYALEGAKGEIGFIGALSDHFCDTCNRLRLTASGNLRGCLFSDSEIDLRTPLRKGESDTALSDLVEHDTRHKPQGHGMTVWTPRRCVRPMSGIGG
jgi:GTP 3',8-cyclase